MDFSRHIKPLNGEGDWPMWKRKIRDLLDYHEGAIEVIDGKLKKTEILSSEATEAEIKKHKEQNDLYRKANSYAKSMIASTVTDAVYQKIMDKETAFEAWESLKQQFEATSKDQLFKICTEFFAFNWVPGEDVSTHIAKLRSLWNELNNGLEAANESKLPDLMLVCKILHILPSQFETFQSSWMLLAKDEKKSFEELTAQLCMFERNFAKTEDSKSVQEALVVSKSEKHKQERKNKLKTRKEDSCNYCKRKGHWVKDCRQWIADGRPPKTQTNTIAANIALMSIPEEACAAETSSTAYWIDNGATRHVTNCSRYFVDFENFRNPCGIKAAGNEILDALGKGTIKVKATINGKCQEVLLKDVWYVPKISRNLFSVLAAQDKNQNSEFMSTSTECWLKVNSNVVLHGSRSVNGTLFKADIEQILPEEETEVHLAETNSSLLQLYHERWGHQDKRHIRSTLARELGISVNLDKEICEPCIYGKAHRLPFGTREKTSEPGELITADVCGPFDESFQKKQYFVLFKDTFTKFRYCYIIKAKSEVEKVLEHMLAHAKVTGHSIKQFLSDNGGEFDNEDVRRILKSRGITQRLTAPYTPEQNGGSEREMRTIVEMARTFKYANPEANFPAAIWAELVNSAVYILNRTGPSSVEDASPYELWLKKKPRLKHLRVIGSTCYAHIPTQKRRKMDKKAVKGYLVGYDGDERYRIYTVKDHRVILSRDVTFQEKTGKCGDDNTELLQETDDEESNQGKCEEQIVEIKGMLRQDTQNEECEESEVESEEDAEPTTDRQLRDRSVLQRPKRFEDHILEAESFINENENPETYEEAVNAKDNTNWKKAMKSEMISLQENQTWELTDLPVGARAIPCKWVYRLKRNPDGSIDKYKARLVVKGFSQRQGIDYGETYSPVAKLGTIRTVLSIAAEERMHLTQFDVSTAFLYGDLEETIYMQQPEGFKDGTEKVCRLKRSLYGLKQSPRCWNKCFGQFLIDLGFKASEADPCLYIHERNSKKLLIALYVDDGLIAATNQQDSEMFIKKLKEKFKISVGEVSCFLGLEIECHSDNSITVSQKAYARKILQRFGFDECKPVATPMLKDSGLQEPNAKTSDFPYRQAVGALMYLMVGTRPDLAYSIGFLSRSLENPSAEDIVRVKRVFRYIAATAKYGITYRTTDTKGTLQCYSDSDFGGCTKTGRSTSGYVMIYAGGAISWRSQRQAVVATSTTEAEVIAASEAAKEVIWLYRLLQGIVNLKEVPTLQVDNRAAVKLSHNPEYHRRTKHIELKHFFVREKVLEGKLNVEQVSTEKQLSDILTKPLSKSRLLTLCNQMGLF